MCCMDDSAIVGLHLSFSCSSASKSLKKLSNVSADCCSTTFSSFVVLYSKVFWTSEFVGFSAIELVVTTEKLKNKK